MEDSSKMKIQDATALVSDGIAVGDVEILADDLSNNVRARLAGGVAALYPAFA
jgi:hypothetical protein